VLGRGGLDAVSKRRLAVAGLRRRRHHRPGRARAPARARRCRSRWCSTAQTRLAPSSLRKRTSSTPAPAWAAVPSPRQQEEADRPAPPERVSVVENIVHRAPGVGGPAVASARSMWKVWPNTARTSSASIVQSDPTGWSRGTTNHSLPWTNMKSMTTSLARSRVSGWTWPKSVSAGSKSHQRAFGHAVEADVHRQHLPVDSATGPGAIPPPRPGAQVEGLPVEVALPVGHGGQLRRAAGRGSGEHLEAVVQPLRPPGGWFADPDGSEPARRSTGRVPGLGRRAVRA
jgi:hypothetical protein